MFSSMTCPSLSITIQLNDPSNTSYTYPLLAHPLLARIVITQYYVAGTQDNEWPPILTRDTRPIFGFSF